MKRTTLKDIAKATGLSISGVSRALKDHPDIGKETKQKVKEVAEALNYIPNLSARSLRTQASGIIAVILPELSDFFFPKLLKGISEVVEEKGYSLVFLQSNNNLEKEKELIDFCLNISAEGVLLSLSVESDNLEHLEKLKKAGIPIILIDRIIKNNDFPSITIDDRETAFYATEHLIRKGYKNILGIFADQRLKMTQLRVEGFEMAHALNKISLSDDQILRIPSSSDLENEIQLFLKNHPKAKAIFTMTDTLLVHTYQVINNLGYKIPEDISLISISDGIAPNYLFPKITHLFHSGFEVGNKASNLLFNIIEGMAPAFNFYKIEAQLVERDS